MWSARVCHFLIDQNCWSHDTPQTRSQSKQNVPNKIDDRQIQFNIPALFKSVQYSAEVIFFNETI